MDICFSQYGKSWEFFKSIGKFSYFFRLTYKLLWNVNMTSFSQLYSLSTTDFSLCFATATDVAGTILVVISLCLNAFIFIGRSQESLKVKGIFNIDFKDAARLLS